MTTAAATQPAVSPNVIKAIELLKQLGFKWEKKTIGVKFKNGLWRVNVMVLNDDGSKKPVYGLLSFESVDDAVDAEILMRS